jgi:PIN like domain
VPAKFFVDENDLALGKALRAIHGDVVYPGHGELPSVARGALDDEWLPVIGSLGLVVITRDQRIRHRLIEKQLWVEHRVRGFVLTGRRSQSTADSIEILAHNWDEMGALIADLPRGPWMVAVNTGGLRLIDLAG